jgi:hypothetical protein
MKKIVLISLLISLSFSISAQTNISFLGTWNVEKVIVPEGFFPKEQAERLTDFISAFSKSSFKFEENDKFVFDFSYAEMQIPNGKWTYDSTKKIIKITEFEDHRSILMMITVENGENGQIYFVMHESPFRLKMKKRN